MNKLLYRLIIITNLTLPGIITHAGTVNTPVVSMNGGVNHWLILNTNADLQEISATGIITPQSYYLLPKVSKLKAEIVNNGKTIHIFLPSPLQYQSLVSDYTDVSIPSGIEMLSPLLIAPQMTLVIKPGFKEWLNTLPTDTQISFRTRDRKNGEIQVSTSSDFSQNQFISSTNDCFLDGKEAFLTIIRTNETFTQTDVLKLVSFFSVTINNLVTTIVAKQISYPYPDAGIWNSNPQKSIPFYQAFENLDKNLVPLAKASAPFSELQKAQNDSLWKRDFLNSAFNHYYGSDDTNPLISSALISCNAYSVRLKTNLLNESFNKNFYAIDSGSIEIQFLAKP